MMSTNQSSQHHLPSLTIETKVWEADWRIILETGRLQRMFSRNNYPHAQRVLFINNVNDYEPVKARCQQLIEEGAIDRYVVVADYADEALAFFQLTKESFGVGYVYSIAELVSIYLCETDYLLHFSGDTCLKASYDWLPQTMALMADNPQVKVATMAWNGRFDQVKRESFSEDADYYYCSGFSDQMYLVRAADFRQPIFSEKHPYSERYPQYGGELFEKRVDSWLRNHDYRRVVWKHGSYRHVSIRGTRWGQFVARLREALS
jgi:hypothetical protein